MKEWFTNNVEFSNDEEAVLKSTDIWNRFKKENKDYIVEKNITIDSFKELLMKIVDTSYYVEKSKKGAIELIGFKMKEIELEKEKEVEKEKELEKEKEIKPKKEKESKSKKEKESKPESISKKEGQIIKEVDFFSQEEETESNLIIDFAKEEVINEIIVKHEYSKRSTKSKQNSNNIYYFDEKIDKKILHEYNYTNKNIMMLSSNYNVRPWEVVSLLMKHQVIAKRGEARGYDIYKETDEYKDKIQK
jgi:hypothetical protein